MSNTKKIDRGTVLELAVRASVDPRTIEKAARGEPVRGLSGLRAARVLREAGILAGHGGRAA
jgi:hypothetical protein